MRHAGNAGLVLAAFASMAGFARQPAVTPPPDEPERSRRDLADVPIPPTPPPVQPAAIPSVPGSGLAKYALPGRRYLPEGAFVSGIVGTLIRTGKHVVFVPVDKTADEKQPASQPFVLLPCQKLSQLDGATRSLDPAIKVVLTGQVYVYRNLQYLLVNAYSVRPLAVATEAPPSNPPAETSTDAADPRVADLIRDLENDRGAERLLDPATPAGSPVQEADDAKQNSLTPEGTLISNRRGRIVRQRNMGGRLSFAFDNDPNSPATQPMIIMPCGLLLAMEQLAASRGDELTFTVSGRVLAYEGRNYLLPILYRVKQPTDVKPLQ